jgi:hypothetical protein
LLYVGGWCHLVARFANGGPAWALRDAADRRVFEVDDPFSLDCR